MKRLTFPALLALVCSGCYLPYPRPTPVGPPQTPCLREPPPAPDGPIIRGVPDNCPPQFEACMDIDEVRALNAYLAAMQRWSREAWARCGAP